MKAFWDFSRFGQSDEKNFFGQGFINRLLLRHRNIFYLLFVKFHGNSSKNWILMGFFRVPSLVLVFSLMPALYFLKFWVVPFRSRVLNKLFNMYRFIYFLLYFNPALSNLVLWSIWTTFVSKELIKNLPSRQWLVQSYKQNNIFV